MSEMRESINRRVDKTNKRIDTLYDLLGKIYKILIKEGGRRPSKRAPTEESQKPFHHVAAERPLAQPT
jgi:hypothetical protein